MEKQASVRIYVLFARNSSQAIIIRRGPTRHVRLISWNRKTDEFTPGQWLKGRIYERRCDLSPSGRYFIYFAAKHKPPYGTWTAVSKPPYFTALALWPKGDAWGGGGLFVTDNEIMLNHGEHQMLPAEDFSVPKKVRITSLRAPDGVVYAGHGEDDPIQHWRLLRDGWSKEETAPPRDQGKEADIQFPFDPPYVYTKRFSFKKGDYCQLNMIMRGIGEVDGPWHVIDYDVTDSQGRIIAQLGRIDWADWDTNGDLLFANDGVIFRRRRLEREPYVGPIEESTELIDLKPMKFEELAPAPAAGRWF